MSFFQRSHSLSHKMCKVNFINYIVCKKSSFKVDIRQKKGGKSDRLSRLFTYGVPIPLNTF